MDVFFHIIQGEKYFDLFIKEMVPSDVFFNIILGGKYFDLFLKEMVPADIFFNIIQGDIFLFTLKKKWFQWIFFLRVGNIFIYFKKKW